MRSYHIICAALVLVLITSSDLYGTHNRAGEITYEQIDELTIRATIVTYTRTSSFSVDRDSLTLYWGDGDSTVVFRTNGNGEELPNDIKKNEYVGDHTYASRGSYKLSVTDPNRIANILNIDFPNSVNIEFYIETSLTLLEPRFQGVNNSVILLQPPIDFACGGEIFIYNPNAFDPDGDSISYELITPFSEPGVEVPNYEFPDQISPGDDNMYELDPITGEFRWESPKALGEYNITYRINEWRNGERINSMVRDMQILVRACNDANEPPVIEAIEEICVIAGEELNLDILAMDANRGEFLTITASGGPFEQEVSPAVLIVPPGDTSSMLTAQLNWQTTCDHISGEFYQVVIRVTDEVTRPNTGLADLHSIRIKVIPPSAQDIQAENENNIVTLTWEEPYECQNTGQFRGFSVWRRIGSRTISIDSCIGGLEGEGYEKVVFLSNEIEAGRFIARDAELEPNQIYCYRVVPEFALLTPQGNPYNAVQGLPSEEVCIRSSGESPLITNVDVLSTDASSGAIKITWINPTTSDIDTTILTGPYRLEVLGGTGLVGGGMELVEGFTYPSGSFGSISDVMTQHDGIDTRSTGHSYEVVLTSGGTEVGRSRSASSIFAEAISSDQSVVLAWEVEVPWNNFNYRVYSADNLNIVIDSTAEDQLRIEGLENGTEYCFVIESVGSYGVEGIPEPLFNRSNEVCAVPMDDVPPCTPVLEITSICEDQSLSL